MVWYATLEDCARAMDSYDAIRNGAQLRRCLESASRMIDGHRAGTGLLGRRFYPEYTTLNLPASALTAAGLSTFPYDLLEATTLTVSGDTVSVAGLRLLPEEGPPYDLLQFVDGTATWPLADTSLSRPVALTGRTGYTDEWDTAGQLSTAATTSSVLQFEVTAAVARQAVGTGSIVRCGTEYAEVTRIRPLSVTTVATTLDDNTGSTALEVASGGGAKLVPDDTITVGSEQMLVLDVLGDTLIVQRAWAGTVPAEHLTGAAVNAGRELVCRRGALGSSAASHADDAALDVFVIPGGVNALCVAQTITTVARELAAYAGTSGQGDNAQRLGQGDLDRLKADAVDHFGAPGWIGV